MVAGGPHPCEGSGGVLRAALVLQGRKEPHSLWFICSSFHSEPWSGRPGGHFLAGWILSYLHPHQHSSFQLPYPKLGHIPEGQIKGSRLLLSAPIRPQLRQGAHPGRLPWPLTLPSSSGLSELTPILCLQMQKGEALNPTHSFLSPQYRKACLEYLSGKAWGG